MIEWYENKIAQAYLDWVRYIKSGEIHKALCSMEDLRLYKIMKNQRQGM